MRYIDELKTTLYMSDLNISRLIDNLIGKSNYIGCGAVFPQSKFLRRIVNSLLPKNIKIYRTSTDTSYTTWRHNAYTLQSEEALYKIATLIDNSKSIDGDFMECGVWRGGVGILAAEILKNTNKKIILADSYQGLPFGDVKTDGIHGLNNNEYLSVSDTVVKNNFDKLRVDSRNVMYVKGFFSDTLPMYKQPKISILHVDADIYSSVMCVLESLYDSVSPGGYIIMDDFFRGSMAEKATYEFLEMKVAGKIKNGYNRGGKIFPKIHTIDGNSCYWQKE